MAGGLGRIGATILGKTESKNEIFYIGCSISTITTAESRFRGANSKLLENASVLYLPRKTLRLGTVRGSSFSF